MLVLKAIEVYEVDKSLMGTVDETLDAIDDMLSLAREYIDVFGRIPESERIDDIIRCRRDIYEALQNLLSTRNVIAISYNPSDDVMYLLELDYIDSGELLIGADFFIEDGDIYIEMKGFRDVLEKELNDHLEKVRKRK